MKSKRENKFKNMWNQINVTWRLKFNNTLTKFNKYVTKWRVGSRKWKGAWSVDIYSSRVKRNN